LVAAFIVGITDDHKQIRPLTKFIGQLICATMYTLQSESVIGVAATVVWIVLLMNAFNLVDNMDGIATSLGMVACFALAITSSSPVLPLVVAGSLVGFLLVNMPPARQFMGDAGSQSIGFMIAVMGVESVAESRAQGILLQLSFVAVPVFDVLLVTVSRAMRGLPFYEGGLDHTSHRLAKLGLTDLQVLVSLVLIAAAISSFALFALL
jgi:UDP-GlcNAc:undecaprenyl-phosphate/decaprenyl-phosphate GlcNAc-1-phosphate transferase